MREIAADLLQGFFTLFGRQVAPVAFGSYIAFGNIAGSFSFYGNAILGRTARPQRIAACAGLLLLLIFDLFYELVERFDDAVFDLAHFGAGAAKVQPAADVVHAPSDMIERIVFQAVSRPASVLATATYRWGLVSAYGAMGRAFSIRIPFPIVCDIPHFDKKQGRRRDDIGRLEFG